LDKENGFSEGGTEEAEEGEREREERERRGRGRNGGRGRGGGGKKDRYCIISPLSVMQRVRCHVTP